MMRRLRLAPYQSGLWLAAYLDTRCQLCRTQHRDTLSKPSHQTTLPALEQGFVARWRARFEPKHLLCAYCHARIQWLPKLFDVDIATGESLPIQAATYYDYPIRQAIVAFKQHEDITKLPLLVHVLRQLPRPKGCHAGNSILIPMPTTDQRLIKRGFDPVTILSTYLSKHWQIPLWHGVQRIDNTVSQQGLSRAERLTNLNNAFMLTKPVPVKRLLLFDDVATTGASLQALAHTIHSQAALGSIDHVLAHSATDYHITAYAVAHGSYYHK